MVMGHQARKHRRFQMQNTITASESASHGTAVGWPTPVEYSLRTGTVVTYLVLGCLIAVSSLLPWARIWFVEVTGLQWGIGWLVLPTGAASAIMAGISLSKGRAIRGLRLTQFVAAAAAILAFAIAYSAIKDACDQAESALLGGGDSGSCVGSFMGIGCVISLLAGSTLGVFAVLRGPTRADR
jgi:hypothetical protein